MSKRHILIALAVFFIAAVTVSYTFNWSSHKEWDSDNDGRIDCTSDPLPSEGDRKVFLVRYDSDGDGLFGTPTDQTTTKRVDDKGNAVYDHDIDSDGIIDSIEERSSPTRRYGRGPEGLPRKLIEKYISDEAVFVRSKSDLAKHDHSIIQKDITYLDRLAGNAAHIKMDHASSNHLNIRPTSCRTGNPGFPAALFDNFPI